MDNVVRMRVGNRLADVLEDGHETPAIRRRVGPCLQQPVERAALDPFHSQERAAVRQGAEGVQGRGTTFLFALPVAGKAERFVQALRALPAGLSEWAVHPAVGGETAAEADLGWAVRRSDHAFLTSGRARRVIEEEGIVVVDHRALQRVWAAGPGRLDAAP